MGETRAYALAVSALRAALGAASGERERFRALVRKRLAPAPPTVRDRLGPIHRRVPGAPVVSAADPAPADLEDVLAGGPVAPDRAVPAWHVVEALAAGLASASATLTVDDVPDGLLAPLALPVPPVAALTVDWSTLAALRATAPGFAGWADDVETPDVVVFRWA